MANFLDTFSASDGTLLTGHTSDSGQDWEGSPAIVITDNQVRNTATGGQIATVAGASVNDDATGAYDIAFVPYFHSNSKNVGVVFNYQDASNYDYARIQADSVDLYQVTGGNFSLVRNDTYGTIPASPQVMPEVKVEVRPTTLQVFYGGVALHTAQTASANPRSDGIGIRCFDNAGLVGWRMESMSCTNVSVAAPGPTITTADNITEEGQTATLTLSGNTSAPTSATLNGTDVGTLTDQGAGVYSYTAPLIADDDTADLVVSVDGTTASTTISYANSYPYVLTQHGTPNANSIFYNAQFATNGPVEWGVVTDYNSAIVIVDHAAMDAAEDELNDVGLHSTTASEGTTTATYKYFVQESGATGTWQASITVTAEGGGDAPVIGIPSLRAVGFRKSIRSATRNAVGSSIH